MKKSLLAATLALATALSASAHATDYLTGSVGYFDFNKRVDPSTLLGLEYRFNEWKYNFRPIIGAFVNTDGGTYGYAGLNYDVTLMPNQLYLVPNFAVGAYGRGSSKDLGGVLEFRSGIELDYQLPNTQQIGIALNHISNASIYSHNPGEETILVNYSVPFASVMR
jgi:lipid A 3-O-deacylase